MNREINRHIIINALEDHLKECKAWHSQEDSRYYMRKEIDFQWEWIIHEHFKDKEIASIHCDHVDCDWKYHFKVTYNFEEIKK
jgi:hypothetical protein